MERDWARLGRKLAAARGERTQQQVASELEIGLSTLQAIEGGASFKKVTPTIRAYARFVGWTDDSPELVLSGGEPALASDQAPAGRQAGSGTEEGEQSKVAPADLSLRVIKALQEGPLLDSQVLTVSTPGGELRATIVVRGEPDRTPEELHKALLAWQEREDVIRMLSEPDADEEADEAP